MEGKGNANTENSQMASIGAIFSSTYHKRQLIPWLNSSASLVVNCRQLSASLGEMKPIKRQPKHSWTSDKPQK